MRLVFTFLFTLVIAGTAGGQNYTISTFAGGIEPPNNILGNRASLYSPGSVALDATGNVFFSDSVGQVILRLDATTGVLTLVAGNGTFGFNGDGGLAVNAQLNQPSGVAVDDATGNVFFSDSGNNCVREISNGVITTVAGNGMYGFGGDNGPASSASLNSPEGVAIGPGGSLFIADSGNNRIREVLNGTITTVAGNGAAGFGGDNGPSGGAELKYPDGVALDAAGNLYIADTGNSRVRMVANGVISTVAGNGTGGSSGDNGPATSAEFNIPFGLALDGFGDLYIAEYGGNRIRKVSSGVITTVAGNGDNGFTGDQGSALTAELSQPQGVAVDSSGNLYIADYFNHRIRRVASGTITSVAGSSFVGDSGSATGSELYYPEAVALDSTGNLFIADYRNSRVRKVSGGVISTVAGTGAEGFGGDNGPAASAELQDPIGVAVASSGDINVSDTYNNRIRKISDGVITTVAGNGSAGFNGDNGPAVDAQLNTPYGITLDPAGNLYIADFGNNRVRKVVNGVITTVAGSGVASFGGDNGPAISAELNEPEGIAVDSAGNIYIAEFSNNRVRKVTKGTITTIAGNGTQGFGGDGGQATNAQLSLPSGLSIDSAGNLYIADEGNYRIRKVANGLISTVAGNGGSGFSGDGGSATSAQFGRPRNVTLDAAGNIYVADFLDNRIRLLTREPSLQTLAVVSAANSQAQALAPGMLATAYGSDLASSTPGSTALPLPTADAGTTVSITDSTGNVLAAPLLYVSPQQVNFEVPIGTALGMATIDIVSGDGNVSSGNIQVDVVVPGLFELNSEGLAAADTLTVSGSTQTYGSVFAASSSGAIIANPISLGANGQSVYLILFGTGFQAAGTAGVTVSINGVTATVSYAGMQGSFPGLDQANVLIPDTLAGLGNVTIQLTANGIPANPVNVTIQ